MAKIIEYYIPESFRKKAEWIPPDQRGKVIQFPAPGEIVVPTSRKSGETWGTHAPAPILCS